MKSITENEIPSNKGHFVYVLRCSDGSLYTGYTTDLPRRIAEHNEGKGAKYTRGRGPVSLVYFEQLADRSSGQKREQAIKRLSRAAKEALVRDWTTGIAGKEGSDEHST
jgi:putative endonuclease